MKILMIEDDKTTVEVIRLTLEVQDPDSKITCKEKGREGLDTARNESFDVVVLDLGLPDIDGLKVLQELRGFSQMPVLVVSARHDPAVITNALDLGAQDYILKPFKFQSFLTSLKEVCSTPKTSGDRKTRGCITDDLSISQDGYEAFVKGKRVELRADEWKVLNTLIEHRGRIVSVKDLTEMLSEGRFISESMAHLTINQLRKKLGDDPYIPKIIVSEYECGYRFVKQTISGNSAGIPALKIV
jgi:two-component system, OmpR family, KDP operon response regulator KdpE